MILKKLYIITKKIRYRGLEIGRKFVFKYNSTNKEGCTICQYYKLCSKIYILKDKSSLLHMCAIMLRGNYYVP